MSIELKTRGEMQAMRAAGLVLIEALGAARQAARPGVSTLELDAAFAAVLDKHQARPSFLGYHGFSGHICTSVNEEIVHGIPSDRVLADGDLLSVDGGCIVDGWHADSAFSIHVGQCPSMAEADLIAATDRAMWAGIAAATGRKLGEISHAIAASIADSAAADGRRYGNVAGYGGHGIGSQMHMDPFVPNSGKRGAGPRLVPGMALAIEPMLTLGTSLNDQLDDGWTVVTRDGSRAAHIEHTMVILADGIAVTTAADGGVAGLAPFDVPVVDLDA